VNLYDQVLSRGKRWVAPMAAPLGARLAGLEAGSLRQDEAAHARALTALQERYEPDIIFPLMDLSPFIDTASSLLREVMEGSALTLQAIRGREAQLEEAAYIEAEEVPVLISQARVMEMVKASGPALRTCFLPGPFHLTGSIFGAEELVVEAASGGSSLVALVMEFATRFLGECAGALAEWVDLVMLVEPELSMLYPPLFKEMCLPFLEGLSGVIRAAGAAPLLRVTGDCSHLLEELVATGAEGLSLDHHMDLRGAARSLPLNLIILGNLDVRRLVRSSAADVRDKVSRLAASMSVYRNFIISTSGEADPATPLENLEAFFAAARSWSR